MNGTNVQFRFGHFGSGTPDVRWKYAYVSKLRKQTRVQTTKASMESNNLRLVPSTNAEPSAAQASIRDTANTLGVHDTLRYGPRSLVAELNGANQYQKRLDNWEETQDNLKLNLQRHMFGMHAPMRQLMERKIVASSPHMPNISRSNVHLDILMGRDETLDVSDFFGTAEYNPLSNMDDRAYMERKHRI